MDRRGERFGWNAFQAGDRGVRRHLRKHAAGRPPIAPALAPHERVGGVMRPSASQPRMTSAAAGPNCSPAAERKYHTAFPASASGSAIRVGGEGMGGGLVRRWTSRQRRLRRPSSPKNVVHVVWNFGGCSPGEWARSRRTADTPVRPAWNCLTFRFVPLRAVEAYAHRRTTPRLVSPL